MLFVSLLHDIDEVPMLREYSTFFIACTNATGWTSILERNKLNFFVLCKADYTYAT